MRVNMSNYTGIMTNRMSASQITGNAFGDYLRDLRTRLDPAAFGLPLKRRRTPGLRREEVAQRANVSATWYTWLEQGRGGAPSADLLDRLAHALMLTNVEREHLFLLGLGRPPEVRFQDSDGVSPRLQRVLDAFCLSPAVVKTPVWDVLAWNSAFAAVMTDFAEIDPAHRNILRRVFTDPHIRTTQPNWDTVAQHIVATFRADVARAGAADRARAFVEELSAASPEFAALWRSNDVRAHSDGTKTLHRPEVGQIAMDFSAFSVEGRPDLGMIVYNPATPADTEKVRQLIDLKAKCPVPHGQRASMP